MEAKKAKLNAEIKNYLDNGKDMKEIAEIKVEQRNLDRIKSYVERDDYKNLEKLYRRNYKTVWMKRRPNS